jgi:hypothetical protein
LPSLRRPTDGACQLIRMIIAWPKSYAGTMNIGVPEIQPHPKSKSKFHDFSPYYSR